MKQGAAILFLTHEWNTLTRLKFERLQREIGDLADLYLLMQDSAAAARAKAEGGAVERALSVFDAEALPGELGYSYGFDDSLVPGSVHYPLIRFGLRSPYEHYFLIEYDVEFSGRWDDLVSATLDQAPDLAASHFLSFAQSPRWVWWKYYAYAEADRDWASVRKNLRRSFNPIFCLSHRALELVHAAHLGGWRAHNELILASILGHHACRCVDLMDMFGAKAVGTGKLQARHSTANPWAIRYRPKIDDAEFLARSTGRTLFHPIKDRWYFDGSKLVRVQHDRE